MAARQSVFVRGAGDGRLIPFGLPLQEEGFWANRLPKRRTMTEHAHNHDQWWQIDATFAQALELSPEERAGFLEIACQGDEALRQRVERLLAAHEASEAYLEDPADWLAIPLLPGLDAEEPEAVIEGQHVGPYRLLREIGRGGMGTVYLAERADGQFHQRVALKLIRGGFVTEDAVRRFRLEREILARLEHPNIARLLDGGLTETGWPYFVMEYVAGASIAAYCDEHKQSISERLALFQSVCRAVHYAHQNLIVHRDLTPNNILVTDDGQAKLLDFGIAKLLDEASSPWTMPVTEKGVRLMTPEYASPEQVRGEPVTTASDVYQLGVVLYELLTGHRPYQLPSRVLHEIVQVICGEDPEKPSTAVTSARVIEDADCSTKPVTPEAVCQARNTTLERLRRYLSGDLDNIVLTAMRKEPARRYASAEQLGEDIARHLAGLTVRARRDTFGYRASKFVRRHRVGVVATCLVALSLLGGLTVAVWQARVAAHERDLARQEAAKARQVTEFMVNLFQVADPAESRGDTLTAHQILDRGARRISSELATQPAVQATMMDAIGRVYQNLGSYDAAMAFLEEAFEIRQRTLPPAHPDVIDSQVNLAWLLQQKDDHDAADSLVRSGLAVLRTQGHTASFEMAGLLIGLARVMHYRNDLEAADSLYRAALAMQRSHWGNPHSDIAQTLNDLGLVAQNRGAYDTAEAFYRESLAMRRDLYGEVHPNRAITLSNLGWLFMTTGNYAAADSTLQQMLAMRRTLYGDEHPHVARGLVALAELYIKKGKYDQAEAHLREAIAMQRKLLGETHTKVGFSMNSLGSVLQEKGDYAAAESAFREAVAIAQEHNDLGGALYVNNLAGVLKDKGDFKTAEAMYRRAWQSYRDRLGDAHPFTAIILGNVASALHAQDAYDHAESMYREALQTLQAAWPDDHPSVATVMVQLATLLMDRNVPQQAEPLLREALGIRQRALPEGDGRIAQAQSLLGACLGQLQRYDEAEPLLRESYRLVKDLFGDQHNYTLSALDRLITFYKAWGKPDEAATYEALRVATASSG